MAEETRKSVLLSGLGKLLKILWIILKSFGRAVTLDFYENLKKYYGKVFKKSQPQEKPEDKPPLPP